MQIWQLIHASLSNELVLPTFSNNNYTALDTFYKILLFFYVLDLNNGNSKSVDSFMLCFGSLLNNTDRQLKRGAGGLQVLCSVLGTTERGTNAFISHSLRNGNVQE